MGSNLDELEGRLSRMFGGRGGAEIEAGTIVVVPSISFPAVELRKITAIERYEERLLFVLLLLARAELRIVYVTSMAVDPAIIDYYLSFTPDPASAGRRLTLIDVDDPEPRALSSKLVEQPDALRAIGDAIEDPSTTYVLPFNVTEAEAEIARRLDVPLFGPRPDLIPLGSKSGSRRTAREAGVPVLDGAEDLYSIEELEEALHALHIRRAGMSAAVIKLNNGFSGQGNAIVRLDGYHLPLDGSDTMFCAPRESWGSFRKKIEAEGCIVEELIRRPGVVSPSAQARILPDGTTEILSTHEQILGDPDGQVYLGCRFPARQEYRLELQDAALRVGKTLARAGVIGSFGIDFVVVPDYEGLTIYLTEINLRMGGTTHPFLMARYVTGGTYDAATGDLLVDGKRICYVATDNLKAPGYAALTPARVTAVIAERGLAYEPARRAGVTLHLLGALPRHGKLGALCIAPTMPEAEGLYGSLVETLDDLAVSI